MRQRQGTMVAAIREFPGKLKIPKRLRGLLFVHGNEA